MQEVLLHCNRSWFPFDGVSQCFFFHYPLLLPLFKEFVVKHYMAHLCAQYNTCSDWLILGHSSVIPIGQLQVCENKVKSHIQQSTY